MILALLSPSYGYPSAPGPLGPRLKAAFAAFAEYHNALDRDRLPVRSLSRS